MVCLYFFTQIIQNRLGSLNAQITHNQNFFQFLVKFIINFRKTVKYRINSGYNIISCLGQSFDKPAEKTFLFSHISFLSYRFFLFT